MISMNTVSYTHCTVTQAAEWLQVSRETIYNWVGSGRLDYMVDKYGDKTKYLYAPDLDQIRHERCVAAGDELTRLQAVPRLGG